MTASISFHNPDITTTDVTCLSTDTWTLAVKDEKNDSVTFFLSDATKVKAFARLIIALTDAQLANPYYEEINRKQSNV